MHAYSHAYTPINGYTQTKFKWTCTSGGDWVSANLCMQPVVAGAVVVATGYVCRVGVSVHTLYAYRKKQPRDHA